MVDIIAVSALVISVVSAVFVIIREGLGLAHGFRESETTQKRRKEIDESLREEVREIIKNFSQEYFSKDLNNEDKKLEEIEEVGYSTLLSRITTETIIDNTIDQAKTGFRNLALALYMLFVTIVTWSLFYPSISELDVLIVFSLLPILSCILFVSTFNNFKKHSYLRETFIRLYENPNIKFCRELADELTDKGLW